MDELSQDVVSLLQYLLPGFLAAWIYYGFTSFELPSQFERVIQALIFTLLVQPVVFFVRYCALYGGHFISLGAWSQISELTASVICAFVLGALFAAFANNDKFHKLMRFLRITKETSYPSEWYGAFSNNITFIVLHLKDGNKVYGWPSEWPSVPGTGHFLIEQASWLDDENKEVPMTNVRYILVPASEVTLVEFLDKTWRNNDVQESG